MKEGVTINESKSRFEMPVDGHTVFIEYKRAGDDFTLTHTEVPKSIEGNGVGKNLVSKTLEYIKSNNWKFVAQCSFIAAYVDRNPEWQEFTAKD